MENVNCPIFSNQPLDREAIVFFLQNPEPFQTMISLAMHCQFSDFFDSTMICQLKNACDVLNKFSQLGNVGTYILKTISVSFSLPAFVVASIHYIFSCIMQNKSKNTQTK